MREVALKDALKDLTIYNTLDIGEFERFVCRFEAGLHETYKSEFSQVDTSSAEAWASLEVITCSSCLESRSLRV